MAGFTVIDDAVVILRSKGVYRQTKAYERAGYIYAGYGGGFVRLQQAGATSLPNVRVEALELGFEPEVTKFGSYLARPKAFLPHEIKDRA